MNTKNPKLSSFQQAKASYKAVAIVFFNTFVLFVGLNIVLAIVYGVNDWVTSEALAASVNSKLTASGLFYENGGSVDNGKRSASDLAVFDFTAFDGIMSEQDISDMLDENYECFHRGVEYQPWVQYSRKLYSGKLLNIDLDSTGIPIRRTINATRPGNRKTLQIFTFGGSTTFGLKTPDKNTWPSELSNILNEQSRQQALEMTVEVTNYGRVGYMPTQELVLLLDLLRAGHRPDLVIFFDGLNWGGRSDVPDHTAEFREKVSVAQQGVMPKWYQSIPIVRFASSMSSRFHAVGPTSSSTPAADSVPEVAHAEQRFLQSRETILRVCEQYDVQALFLLQPDAYYNYPAEMHRAARYFDQELQHTRRSKFYATMRKSGGYVDLTGLFEKFGKKCVIDAAHFTPQFNRFVAEHIAAEIDLTSIEIKDGEEVVIPTGSSRH